MGNRKEDTTNELKEDSNQARMKAAFDSGPLTPLALERSTSIPVSLLLTYLGDLRVQEYVRRCEVTVARGTWNRNGTRINCCGLKIKTYVKLSIWQHTTLEWRKSTRNNWRLPTTAYATYTIRYKRPMMY